MRCNRREFLERFALAAGTLAPFRGAGSPVRAAEGELPRRVLGKTGARVSVIGVGGWHLSLPREESEAIAIVRRALELGVNFIDTAWQYGSSEERLGRALRGRRKDVFLMTKVLARDRAGAEEQLHKSLRDLQTDYLDLWQIHSVSTQRDLDRIFGPGGAMEAALRALREGKTRFLGITGHYDPAVLRRGLDVYDGFATAQMPLNVVDAHYRSFEKTVLPELVQRGMGVLAMKTLANGRVVEQGVATVEETFRYVLSLPVTLVVSGCNSVAQLEENAGYARRFRPLTAAERDALLARTAPRAGTDVEYYKS